jgi:amino acid adenylation domain-containing protein
MSCDSTTPGPSWAAILRHLAASRPEGTAVRFLPDGERDPVELTFGELCRRVHTLADHLARQGGPGERALLLFPPGLDYVTALLACFCSGVVAVPAYPPRAARGLPRVLSLANDSRPRLVLGTPAVLGRLRAWSEGARVLADSLWMSPDDAPALDDSAGWWDAPGANDLALLQYTSGSTGDPKGVLLTHGNLLANSERIHRRFGMVARREVVSWLPPYHDMGLIGGILQPLYAGVPATLMSPFAFLQSPVRWLRAISGRRGVVSGGPSFAYELCLRKVSAERRRELDLSGWEVAFNGAEPVRAETLERFSAAFAEQGFRRQAFYPCYGLAEATLMVTGGEPGRLPPVETLEARPVVGCGGSLDGQEVAVVGPESLTPCAPGEVGEIWVQGPSVGGGYWGRPELSASTFRARLAGRDGEWLRTGDLGFLRGGELFVTGRIKDLLILRGRNLYPQDVEATVERCHPALRPAAGAAFAVEVDGEERLVVVQEVEPAREGEAAAAISALREAVAAEHEAALHEVVLVRAGEVPRTSSGKVRRGACRVAYLAGELAALPSSVQAAAPTVPDAPGPDASGEDRVALMQACLSEQARRILGRAPEPGLPVLSLGLDSLQAVEVQQGVERVLGIAPSLADLLGGATVAEMAARLAQAGGGEDAPVAEGETCGIHPASVGQRGFWFLSRLAPESGAWNIAAAARLLGAPDPAALRRAFERLAERHPALRTTLSAPGDEPVQVVHVDVEMDWAEEDGAADLAARLSLAADLPFDLERGPLLRVRLFHAPEGPVILLVVHHAIADLLALTILVRDLGRLYAAEIEAVPLPPPPGFRPSDFARNQARRLAGPEGERLRRSWEEALSGHLPVLALPFDRPRPPVETWKGFQRRSALAPGTAAGLRDLGRSGGATLFTTLLAAWCTLLHRVSGQDAVLVGSPAAGRSHAAWAGVVGYFANPLVLRADLTGVSTFAELLRQMRQTVLRGLLHQDYPFPLLVDRLLPDRDPSHPPLFQAGFALQDGVTAEERALAAFAAGHPGARVEAGGLVLESLTVEPRSSQFELMLTAAPAGDGLALALLARSDLFDVTTVERLLGHLENLLRELAAGGADLPLTTLPLLTAAERQQVLREWNDTERAYPGSPLLHAPILDRVREEPERVALVFPGGTLTYAGLAGRAAAVAASLNGLGIGPDTPVGVLAERSAEMVVALLGTLLAGGAWLPLDPEQPRERLRSLWRDAGEPVILFQDHLRDRLPAGARGVVLNEPDRSVRVARRANLVAPDADHLAYVLYTSGSTGRPKGAMNSHRAIANRLDWMQEAFGLTPGDRVLQKTPFGFDVSVWEFFWPLRVGARLVMAPPGAHRDAAALVELIEREGITTIHFVPSLLAAFLEREDLERCASLRRVIASGEALPPSLAERFHEHLGGPLGVELWNLYGPTEAAVDVTAWKVEAGAQRGTVPIGRPIASTTLHLLDRGGSAVPAGVAGELCIGGVAPARGYLGRPDLTAERFTPDPLASEPGARLYRTGDLARWRTDGALEYLGRLDHQIKLRGVRIELGEIEEALGALPGVREAAVRLLDNRLVGYLACDPAAPPEPAEVRRALAERLPDVMIPSAFVLLPDFPRTASGKVDRRALPAPEPPAREGEGPSPETPLEQALAEVWREVLGLPRVGLDDNFFALGGDSILTLRVQTLAARRGLHLAFQDLFRHRTLGELAAAVGSAGSEDAKAYWAAEAEPAPFALVPSADLPHLPAGLDDAYPLTRVFAGLVFHSEHSPDYQVYLTSVHLAHPLDPGALQAAADALVRRHPILRTSFSLGATSRPLQLVHRETSLPVQVIDLRGLPLDAHEPALAAWREAELVHRFDWSTAPLARLTVHLRGATAQLSLSEPVLDGWSVATLLTELLTLYQARLSGLPDPALPSVAPLREYVALELRALASDETRAFWRRTLAEATPGRIPRWTPGLCAERTVPGGLPIQRLEVPLAPELSGALAAASRALALPIKSLLLAAHSKVTGLLQGEDDALTGFLLNGRPEIEGGDRTAGLFLHPVPLRLRRSACATWADLAAGAFAAERELLPHRRLPLAELQREQGGPLFDSVFNFTHFHVYRELARLPGVEVLDGFASDQTYVDLTAQFNLDHATGRLRLALDCRARRFGGFDPAQAEAIGGLYRRVLEAMAAGMEAPHDAGAPLGAAERHALLVEHNDTATEYAGGNLLLHELFAAQAARTPEAVALVFEGEVTPYGALARQAGQLAAALREAGVAPGDPVAVCAERSSRLLAGLLGVLEAGGAFLPLDPSHPADRLAWMLEDGLRGVRRPLLLTEPRWLGLPVVAAALRGGMQPVLLGPREDADQADEPPRRDPAPRALPDGPAYALYTSGSTGRPKGVLNTHRGIVNRLLWMQAEYGLGADDRVLQKTPLTFDVSVWELFWPLLTGAALVLARPGGHLDPAGLAVLIRRERVTTVHFVPSLLRVFLETPEAAGCRSLRRVIASGEALDPDLVRRFHEVFPAGPEIHNLYGPTEAAVDVTAWPCRRGLDGAAEGGLPIGRPVANTTIHLLDALAQPVPLGSPGELCIGGVQLARGYLGRPDLTAGRFVPDPFSTAPGGRLYRTGDLARRRTDGGVEFLGRIDHQVKLRGQRIEPGEIEAVLREHPEVAEAVVVVVAGERPEHRRLIAYAVPASGAAPARDALLGFLEARLPRFMVPSDLVVLASLPRTPSGKVDRRALPPPTREEDRIAALLARVRDLADDEVHTLLAQEER